MRFILVLSLSLFATVASADPVARLQPINAEETPEACRMILERVHAPELRQQLTGRIELASCVASAAIAPRALIDNGRNPVAVIDELVGPAFTLLDEVMANGDAATQVAALRMKADIYTRMGARVMATVPRAPDASRKAAAAYGDRMRIAQQSIEPWEDRRRITHQAIVDIGRAHPELQGDRATRLAIADSERKLATPIAARE